MRRTDVVKISVSDKQRDALHRTADYCWSDTSFTECKTNKRKVRDALYSELREETELQAQLVQAAIRRAVEAVKGVVKRWKKGQRVSRQTFAAETMDYDTRSATFYRNKVSLATVEGRTVVRSPGRQPDALRAVRTLQRVRVPREYASVRRSDRRVPPPYLDSAD